MRVEFGGPWERMGGPWASDRGSWIGWRPEPGARRAEVDPVGVDFCAFSPSVWSRVTRRSILPFPTYPTNALLSFILLIWLAYSLPVCVSN